MNQRIRSEWSGAGRHGAWLALAAMLPILFGAPARGQEFILPPTLLLPNYDRVHPGLEEALEAGAFIARAVNVSAVFYNPAGIALVRRTVLIASVQGYELTTLSGSGFQHSTPVSSFEGLPSSLGLVLGSEVIPWENVRVGFAVIHPLHWNQNAVASTVQNAAQRVSYSVSSAIDSLVPTISVSWAAARTLRLGGSIELPYTTLSENGQLSGELTDAATSQGTIRNIAAGGSTFQLRLAGAVQWEPVSWLALGATVRTPGLRLVNGGSFQYDSLTNLNAGTQQIFFQDSDPSFEYRLPTEVGLGSALKLGPVGLEFDVRFHAATHTYPLFRSDKPARVVDTRSGVPVPSEVPFPGIDYRAQAVWNWGVGVHLYLSPAISLSGGMYVDFSPVGAETPVFRRIDLLGFRSGISFHGEKVSGSVGVGWEHGHGSDDLFPTDLPIPSQKGEITVDTFSVLGSVSFRF